MPNVMCNVGKGYVGETHGRGSVPNKPGSSHSSKRDLKDGVCVLFYAVRFTYTLNGPLLCLMD